MYELLNQQDTPTLSLQDILSLYFLSLLSLPPSLSLALPLFLPFSLSLSLFPFVALPFCLQCADMGKAAKADQAMSKDQNASGKNGFGNDAWSDAVRYLERYPKSAEVDRPQTWRENGSCFQTLKSMAESIQQLGKK